MDPSNQSNKITRIDADAFEKLFRMHYTDLQEYAVFYTGCPHLAEDLVHDVFIKIWESRSTIKIHTSIKAYLFSAVHNRCIQYLRRLKTLNSYNKRQQVRLEEALLLNRLFFETGLNRLVERELREKIRESVKKLPDKTRKIFLSSREKKLKNSEIAKKYNLSEKAIEYHISRALRFLRNALKEYLPLIIGLFSCL